VKPNEIISACFGLGLMVTINQRLDMETIDFIADEFGYQVRRIEEYGADIFEEEEEDTDEADERLQTRPPVVTVMGHVDHGKTSLLDYIRRTTVVAGEVGGITQHIGAYEVITKNGKVTFLDTPGHEAFTAMRARGAQLTDLVVLVVAADDKVMPQTIEAINHAKAAAVPIVVAINKVDLPDADPDGVRQQLSQRGVIVEQYGGDTVCVEVSAKTGQGVDRLLELILLQSEMLELKADPTGLTRGVVVEAELDRGRGPIATVLVQKGTLREGDPFLCGLQAGRVRALLDERSNRIEEALPSQPTQVLGFSGVPQPGDTFYGVEDEKEARELSLKRQQIRREQDFAVKEAVSLSDLRSRIESGEMRELPLIVKADADGSVEAVSDSFQRLSTDEVQVKVIHRGVGGITDTDVMLAQASGAVIIGFHVRPDRNSREAAAQAGVEIRLYEIIYEAVEDIRKGLEGLLRPEVREEILGTLEVRDTFRIPKAGTIAGCMVTEGAVRRGQTVRLIRDDINVHDGRIGSLKRFKDDVKEVREGFECGVGLDNYNDIKVGDVIEVYERKEFARHL
jgi:translation initiation factor IF-2